MFNRALVGSPSRRGHASKNDVDARMAVVPFLRAWRGSALYQLALGLLLACLAFGASVALLAISGWFIATSALVALLGITTFSYLVPSAGVRASALLRVGARYGERVVTHRATFSWLARLRTSLFAHAALLSPLGLARFRNADLLDRAMSDVDTLDQVILRVVTPTVSVGLVALGCLLLLAGQSLGIALVVGLAVLAAGVGLPMLTAQMGRRPAVEQAAARTQLRTEMIEALEGSREIAIYGAQRAISERLTELAATADRGQAVGRRITALGLAVSMAVSGAALLGALGIGALTLVSRSRMSAAPIAMLALVTIGLFEGVEALPAAYQHAGAVRRAARRLSDLFHAPRASAMGLPSAAFPAHEPLLLHDVSFVYDDGVDEGKRRGTGLQGINLTIPQGVTMTLVGPSGVGKTTLLRLMAGELEPTTGAVCLGEAPIASIVAKEFWRHVSYVAQDSYVFTGTIRENLLLAAPQASDEALHDTLDAVGLEKLTTSMDMGLDTSLGEGGDRLSGGERRRLCVARALLRHPDILLLDEPTAGVDAATAEHMLTAIRQRLPGSTIIIATHDPLPQALADIVVTMQPDGTVQSGVTAIR